MLELDSVNSSWRDKPQHAASNATRKRGKVQVPHAPSSFLRPPEKRQCCSEQGVFEHRAEDRRRKDRRKHATENASERNPHVEFGEMRWLRPAGCQRRVTQQSSNQQQREVGCQNPRYGWSGGSGPQKRSESKPAGRRRHTRHLLRGNAHMTSEGEDEREQIDRQRQVQRKGTEARFTERCVVTASIKADGTNEPASQNGLVAADGGRTASRGLRSGSRSPEPRDR